MIDSPKSDPLGPRKTTVESQLRRWGWWKRNYILSVGGTGTIEQKIKDRLPFGDGNTGGGPPIGGLNQLKLLSCDEETEKINSAFMQLLDVYREEMTLIQLFYAFKWGFRDIAEELKMGRSTIKTRLSRAKTLVELKLAQL